MTTDLHVELLAAADQPSQPSLPSPASRETDLANARRLIDSYGQDLRYVPEWNSWIAWDGRRWSVDRSGRAHRLAKKVADRLWADAPMAADQREWVRHCQHASSSGGISAMLKVAQTEPGVAVAPEDLDTNPWLLNVRNGTIDLRTAALLPHDRAHLCTKLAPISYDPELLDADLDVVAPTFARFLTTSLGDAEKLAYLRRCAGYSLSGSTREEVLLYLWGPGRNGKSKFLGALIDILGPGQYAQPMPHDLLAMGKGDQHPQRIAAFHGVRLATVVEVPNGRLDVELLKSLTGGDMLTARRMRENDWTFAPTHTLWMTANHDPRIGDSSQAVWERMKKVPFDKVFAGAERDYELADKLRKEYPAILAWALRGCLDWLAMGGLCEPDVVKQATAAYQEAEDTFGEFLDSKCVQAESAVTSSSDLYFTYKAWCAASGLQHPLARRGFSSELKARGFEHLKTHGPSRTAAFRGVGLLSSPPVQSSFGGYANNVDNI